MSNPIITLAAGTTPIEGGTTGTYHITLNTPAPVGGLTVNFNTTGSTATLNNDYNFALGTNLTALTANSFTIAAGATSATLNLIAHTDAVADPNETVLVNLMAGTGYDLTLFAPKVDYPTGLGPYSAVSTGDFNNDGKLDLAIVNGSSNTVSVLLRNATNTGFDAKVDYITGINPFSVSVGDFNNDGKLDLAIGNANSNTVSVLLRNATNTGFDAKVDYSGGAVSAAVTVGDFNNDGKLDLAVGNESGHSVSVLLRNSTNTGFDTRIDYAAGVNPWSVSAGDFNNDGKLDLAVANYNNGWSGSVGSVSVLLRNATNTGFDAKVDYALDVGTSSVTTGDFNNDGKLDLAVTNRESGTVSVLLGNATGFDAKVDYATGIYPTSISVGDFNNDNKLDLAIANSVSNTVSVLLGNATGFDPKVDYAAGLGAYSVSVGDFNNDGKLDLAVANTNSSTVSILLNNLNPTATLTITDVNHAPVLSTPATIIYTDTQYVDTFATATGTLQGSDVDTGSVLTYGITGGTVSADLLTVSKTNAFGTLTVTVADGSYSFVPYSSAMEQLGVYATDATIQVTVTDDLHLSDSKAFTVTITQNGVTETNGNDTFYGTTGPDHWVGLLGNDTYYVNNAGDTITELANQGWDTVYSSISYTLPVNVEALVLQESAGNANATGNNAYNYLVGNSGNNVLSDGGAANQMAGGAGNDTYNVSNAGDVIVENANAGWDMVWSSVSYTLPTNVEALYLYDSAGNANATGNTGNTYLVGNSHNNILSDGGGAATMSGGAGNDSYYVNNSADVITETANQGTDSVYASISYTLSANVENLILTGTAAINATGNGAGNVLTGNSADNIISDGGSAGVATMAGGAGNDTYYVNNSADVITENANAGWDTVYSSTSYTLPVNVEAVVLQESAGNATIKGNNAYNYLVGNSSDNILVDGSATNQMAGGAGNDTYSVSHSGDVIVENTNAGWDTVWSSVNYTLPTNVEELLLYKGAGNINGYGNSSANYMVGNDGNNLLDAQAGNDTLVAGSGNDTLVGGLGQDYYDLSGAAATSSETIRIAAGDSTANFGGYDYATSFKLGTGTINTTGVDKLDLVNMTIAANGVVNGIDSGPIMSHQINNGMITFDSSDTHTSPLAISDGYLGLIFTYLENNISGGQTVGFVCSGNTFVYQDGGSAANDTLIELIGVAATSLSTTGLAAGSVWIV